MTNAKRRKPKSGTGKRSAEPSWREIKVDVAYVGSAVMSMCITFDSARLEEAAARQIVRAYAEAVTQTCIPIGFQSPGMLTPS